jgi:hypothetical protein
MKESFVKKKSVTVPEATLWFHRHIIACHCHVIRMRQEKSYILSADGDADQTLLIFDTSRNTTVKQKGLSAVLIRTSGLFVTLNHFISSLWIGYLFLDLSRKSPQKQYLPKIPYIIFSPPFYEKIGEKCVKIMRVNMVTCVHHECGILVAGDLCSFCDFF